jgi:hypothetical protein
VLVELRLVKSGRLNLRISGVFRMSELKVYEVRRITVTDGWIVVLIEKKGKNFSSRVSLIRDARYRP